MQRAWPMSEKPATPAVTREVTEACKKLRREDGSRFIVLPFAPFWILKRKSCKCTIQIQKIQICHMANNKKTYNLHTGAMDSLHNMEAMDSLRIKDLHTEAMGSRHHQHRAQGY
jgi:hypothetical protein